jgi:hypothetical protein
MLSENTLYETTELPLEELVVPSFYNDLFFAGCDRSFNYPHDPTICVRPIEGENNLYEILAGVELFHLFEREGRETAPVLITEMTADEARRYATDHALRTSAQSARRPVVQLIVAARDNEKHGGVWSVDRVMEEIRIKRSTYTHAWSSINYACLELKNQYPEKTEGLGTTELVAMAVREDFMPAFTSLYNGGMSVNKFYRDHYMLSALALERNIDSRRLKPGRSRRAIRSRTTLRSPK